MNEKKNIEALIKKVLCLLLIIFVYVLGSHVPLPAAEITAQYQELLKSTSISMMGIMSGASFSHLSIFTIGLNPFMITMLIMQLLSLTKIFGFDALSVDQIQIVQQFCIFILSIFQSTFFALNMLIVRNSFKMLNIIIILVAGSMLVTWLCFMNIKYGLGGTSPIILVNIVASIIPTLQQVTHDFQKLPHYEWWMILLVFISLFSVYFWVAFAHAYYPLKTIETTLPSYSKPVIIPIGLNLGAMMTYMIGMAILTIPTMLQPYFSSSSLINNEYFLVSLTFILAFLLFYFFTFVQFEPEEKAKSLRNSHGYILNIRPGKPTQKYLRHLLWIIAFPGALITAFQLTLGLYGKRLLGNYAGLAVIPMNLVMITLFLLGIEDQVSTLLYPARYGWLMKEKQ